MQQAAKQTKKLFFLANKHNFARIISYKFPVTFGRFGPAAAFPNAEAHLVKH